MDSITLSSGAKVPRLIKGGWQLAGGHGRVDPDAAIRDMFAFAEAGITAFDCADIYTGVEALIGEFLRQWRAVHPTTPIRVHTKCVPDLNALSSLTPADINRIVDRSRRRLGVERIDLVQLHWWDYDVPGVVQAAEALLRLREQGALADIGLTNFDTQHMTDIVAAGIPIATHQVQYSLLDRRPAGALSQRATEHGMALLCYGGVAGGFLSDRWLGAAAPAEPLENRSLTKYLLIIEEFGGWSLFQQLLHLLADIAHSLHASIGSVAIRWVLDQPGVGSVIIGARNLSHLAATRRALDIRLDPTHRQLLAALLAQASGPTGDVYDLERVKGGRHAAIMRYNLNAATD
ncbi:MAG: aldo/keto reductase [Gemmatimonadaceae bacterium]